MSRLFGRIVASTGRMRSVRPWAGRVMLTDMRDFDDLELNNAHFAATDAKDHVPAIPFIPNRQVYLITCIDPRVDPAYVFGLGLGDAVVARTVGGRVTAAVLQDLAWISYLHEVKTPDADWFELAVVHHTDCGSALLADDELRHGFAARGGYDEAELAGLAVLDTTESVRADVDKLLATSEIWPAIIVSGYSYDLGTGVATRVVAPRSRAAAAQSSGIDRPMRYARTTA
jgi:carbonic anhydrase